MADLNLASPRHIDRHNPCGGRRREFAKREIPRLADRVKQEP
jgi:hypothetical protein